MTDLRAGWAMAELQDLAAAEARSMTDGPFGSNLKTAHYTEAGPRVIRLQNIGYGDFVDERAHISEDHFATLRNHEVRDGDLVVASLGERLPRSCVIPPWVGPAIVKADCIRVRLHADIDARYVNFALQRPDLKHAVADQIHGVGRPRLGMPGIKALSIPLAPMVEQERIVAAIEEHFSRLDAAQRALDAAAAKLDRLLDVLMMGAGVTAARATLGSLASVVTKGTTPTSVGFEYVDAGVSFVKAESLVDGWIDASRCAAITEEAHNSLRRSQLAEGDLLVTIAGTLGRVAEVRGSDLPANTNQAVALVRPHDPRLTPFLRRWLQTQHAQRDLLSGGRGVGLQNLNLAQIRAAVVPVPTPEAAAELCSQFDAWDESITRQRQAIRAWGGRASGLRRAILDAAFGGRLVESDPADEPASALLGRILAQRPTRVRRSEVAS